MEDADRLFIVEMVRRFGGATADAVLDGSMHYFQCPEVTGIIGYRISAKCLICFGDPICAPADRARLAEAFHQFAHNLGCQIVYVATSHDYAHWAIDNGCGALIEFGRELQFAPPQDPRKSSGPQASLVRRKTKQAAREGVTIHEYIRHDATIEQGILAVKDIWLTSRRGVQVHISNVHLFTDSLGKRWFYAQKAGKIIGVIALNQMQSKEGWLLNHLMVVPDAPNGVPELIMASVLTILEQEGCPFATVGSIGADTLGHIRGLGALSALMIRTLFKVAGKIMQLKGLETFWGKFLPTSAPSYLLFSRTRVGVRELIGLKKAMNGNIKTR